MGGIGGEGATAYGEEGDLGEGAQTVVVSLLKKMKFELKFIKTFIFHSQSFN